MLNVTRSAGSGSLAASVTVSPPSTGGISTSTFFNEAFVTFPNVQPTDGETWTLDVDGINYVVHPHAGQSLADVVAALGNQVALNGNYSVGIGLNSLVIVSGFWLFGFTSIFAFGSITLGPSGSGSAAVSGANVTLAGTPQPGDVWTLTLDGNKYAAYYSSGGLSTIASQLAAQLPTTFAQSQGGAYYSVTVSGNTLTLHRLDQQAGVAASIQVTRYGGAGVTPTRPVGASVALQGTPAAGEIWTLTLDGNTYATAPYSSGGLAGIASQLAALIPTTPAAAHGGAYYTVSLPAGGSTLTIRRVDQAAPVTASVSVSNPATAKTVVVNPTKTTVEYSGMSFAGEVWAVTVDGKTYSYVSSGSETVLSIVTTLKGAITGSYTVSAGRHGERRHADDRRHRRGRARRVRLRRARHAGDAGHRDGDGLRLERHDHAPERVGRRRGRDLDAHRGREELRLHRPHRRRDRADRLRPRHRRHAVRALHRRRDLVVDHAQPGRRNDRRGLARGLDARRGRRQRAAARASRSTSRVSRRRARSGG